jgi:hypothetical protein
MPVIHNDDVDEYGVGTQELAKANSKPLYEDLRFLAEVMQRENVSASWVSVMRESDGALHVSINAVDFAAMFKGATARVQHDDYYMRVFAWGIVWEAPHGLPKNHGQSFITVR